MISGNGSGPDFVNIDVIFEIWLMTCRRPRCHRP